MPAEHRIDTDKKLIRTTWTGEVEDRALIGALSDYQRTIKSNPAYAAFDEIVDFGKGSHFHLSISGMQRLVEIASKTDNPDTKTKLAIVVPTPVAYTLARMYQVIRNIVPRGSKILRVFHTCDEATRWVSQR